MATFYVNGKEVTAQKNQSLLRFLRDELHLTSVKDGCSEGACGACTVIIDGERFEDIHDYGVSSDNPFIPVSLKEDFGGRQLEVYNRFVRVNRWEGGGVTVWLLDGRGLEDPPWSTNRVFYINLKASV